MNANVIQEIAEVTLKKGAFGDRYVVTVDGVPEKFRSEGKVTAYRNEQLALQRDQRVV